MKHTLRALFATATIALLATACGGTTSDEAATTTTEEAAAPVTDAEALNMRDGWVKAAESGMSAAFGVLENRSDEDIVVTAATSDMFPTIELHETVEDPSGEMIMREKEGGFVIPAGGEYLLQPGANHIMLMEMVKPVVAGESVTIALVMEDGSTFEFDATAKDYSGANERYMEGE